MTAPALIADIGACQGCGACLRTCPEHAIRPTPGGLVVRDDRCTGCGDCVEVCPVDVIRLRPADGPDALLPDQLLPDQLFPHQRGGRVGP